MKPILTLLFLGLTLIINAENNTTLKVDSIRAKIAAFNEDSLKVNGYFKIQNITKNKAENIYFEAARKIDSICQWQLSQPISTKEKNFFTANVIELHNNVAKKYMDIGDNKKALEECEIALVYSENNSFKIPRSETFNVIGLIYLDLNKYELSIANFNESLKIRRQANDIKGIGGSLNNIGLVHYYKNDYESAIEFFKKSLKISQENDNKDFASNTLNNIGVLYKIKGDYIEAIKCYNESMQLNTDRGKEEENSTCFSNIGGIYLTQGNVDKAIEYYQKCLVIEQKNNKIKKIANTFNSIAICYERKGKENKATEYHHKALSIFKEINDKMGISMALSNLGSMQQDIGDSLIDSNKKMGVFHYEKAMENYNQSLSISTQINNLSSIALNQHNLGHIYLRLKDYKKAIEKGEISREINNSIGAVEDIEKDYSLLYLAYKEDKQFEKSLEMYENYMSIKDSIKGEEFLFEVQRQEYEFQFNKKQELAKAEQNKKDELSKEASDKKNIILIAFLSFSILVIVFSLFVIKRLKHTKKQNKIINQQSEVVEKQKVKVINAYKQLETKNKEVVDSIVYANRIQTAILPREKMIKETLKDAFILYKPKDIVAGDFYWIEKRKDTILFAAADSTGHGVPGAIVSVICNYALNRSLKEFNLIKPGEILDKTREIVVSEFERSDEQVKDGMDIALCSLKGNQLHYAGANNPLWIIRDNELMVIPSDRQPIAKTEKEKPFKTNEITVQPGDTLYIFSDGYSDQFGGGKGKKLKTQPFKSLLLSIQDKSMHDQKTILEDFFEKWKGELEQVDDVCIIGFRI